MTRTAILLSIGGALILAGCDQAGSMGGDKRIAELEKQVTAGQDQNRDLRTKMAARQSLGQWGWDNFLKSPEFWQCTYDSGWSDCASRCTKATNAGYQACLANNPEGPARQKCVADNAKSGSACLQNCPVQMNPINPASCSGGGPA